ncbi:MOSC domain-containing protein [Massilia aurea]|uniref:MOSC domain-containing protein n=1 Tax=Massilia aurea TaxID=373040 RepID=UPI003461ECB2
MIAGLSIRPAGTSAPQAVDRLTLVAGEGIDGDRHRDPVSPRQLLLASQATYADLALAPHALRENILFDMPIDDLPSGTVLQIGAEAQVRLMFVCEACGRLDLHGARLGARIGARRGVLARVVRGGVIRIGDTVRGIGQLLPAWSIDWHERVRQVIDAMPLETVIDYALLARLAGIQTTYCRAFPRLLASLGPAYAARAIAARAISPLPRWDGCGLFDAVTPMPTPACAPPAVPPVGSA